MQIRLMAFATAADALGRQHGAQEIQLPSDVANVSELKAHLEQQHPKLGAMWHRLAVAVNGEVVGDQHLLHDGDEVALLPPVSGGAVPVGNISASPPPPLRPSLLSEEPLSTAGVQSAVERSDFGAVLLFVGNVRDHHQGRGVSSIFYDAYRSMAEQRLQRLIDELESEHAAKLVITHRLGDVPAGDASVIIGVAAAHREACYEASRSALERLKAEVPIWKREQFVDGDAAWREVEPLGR